MRALQLSQESKYEKGIAESYLMIADALTSIGLYKEALNQLEASEDLKYYKDRLMFQSDVHRLKGKAYVKLNLDDLGLSELREQVRLMSALDVSMRKKAQYEVYTAMASTFRHLPIQRKQVIKRPCATNTKDYLIFTVSTNWETIKQMIICSSTTTCLIHST
ncbi:hypothetical protein [Sphingobacterium thalpophilum]|uniref:hypothetical protein n=1 Tax=Sphingobacterium thalpophilum TaxID=259 RepID=UPI0024A77C2F|nr:hypothetical protein [Sphingobacterium thalpophilum]